MHTFYTPDIRTKAELPEEEAAHCLRVLRLTVGDEVLLTDGKGFFYKALIDGIAGKRCHGSYEEHRPYGVVCGEGYRDWF